MKNLLNSLEARLESLAIPVAIGLPNGRWLGQTDSEVRLHFKDAAALSALALGNVGDVGSAVVEGHVEVEGSMRGLMAAVTGVLKTNPTEDTAASWWAPLVSKAKSAALHTVSRDAQQIQFHYDISDDFYALWLDPRRVYSCAYYREPEMCLAEAQEAKLDHICRKLQLQNGERFLDIGAGWGGLLLWAAENYGVQATGITLSRNQHAHVNRLIEDKGLQGQVRMELCDYRLFQAEQRFDKIASVGMFEHVGRAHMPDYFEVIKKLLIPGGMLLNHGITAAGVSNAELGAGMGQFIEKYIFPGGELLHVSAVLHDMGKSGLEMVDTENLRPHYARTLWDWSDALEAQLEPALESLKKNLTLEQAKKSLRAYRLYLAGCALGFEQGWIALHQMLAIHPDGNMATGSMAGAQSVYPFSRDYIYSLEKACSINSNPGQLPT